MELKKLLFDALDLELSKIRTAEGDELLKTIGAADALSVLVESAGLSDEYKEHRNG